MIPLLLLHAQNICASAKIRMKGTDATTFMQAEQSIASFGNTRNDVNVPETDVKRMRI